VVVVLGKVHCVEEGYVALLWSVIVEWSGLMAERERVDELWRRDWTTEEGGDDIVTVAHCLVDW